jgi:site-specific DNA recombinase
MMTKAVLTRDETVELRGLEPLTSSMPWKRATNCAKAP